MQATPTNQILRMLREYYPDTSWKHVDQIQIRSFNFLYEASDTAGKHFFVKSYRNTDVPKLRSEWRLYGSLMKNHLPIPRVCPNRDGTSGSMSSRPPIAFSVYEYIDGKRYKSGNRLPENYRVQAAQALAALHNTRPFNRGGLLKPMSIVMEVAHGMHIYREILNNLDATSFTKERTQKIRNALTARIAAADEANVIPFLKHLKNLPLTVAHGDYAPSNMIFGKNQAYIVDWERARLYYWQYDLFRAASNFASSGKFTPYDSNKDMTLMKCFLGAYFSRRNKVSQQEIYLLKLMPRIYCFIDTFPFGGVFTRNERWTERYIPRTTAAFSWWLTHEKDYAQIVDMYCNH